MEESTRAILENAIDLMKAGKQEDAVPLLAGLLRNNPDLEIGWFLLGLALKPAHQRIRAFKEVLRINPNNQNARKQLAQIIGPSAPSESLPHINPFQNQTSSPKTADSRPASPSKPEPPAKEAPSTWAATPPRRSAHPPQADLTPKTPAPRHPQAQSSPGLPRQQGTSTPVRRTPEHSSTSLWQGTQPPTRRMPTPSSTPPRQGTQPPVRKMPTRSSTSQRPSTPPPARRMPTPSPTPQRQRASAQAQRVPTSSFPPAKRMPTPYRKTRPAPAPLVVHRRDDSLERVWKRLLDMRMQMVGGVILLIGIALAVLLVSSLAKDVPLWIFGKTADGTILEKTWSEFDYHDPDMENKELAERLSLEMQYYFDYQFTTPNGEIYFGHTEVTENEFNGYNNGNTIKVRYSVLNPENSRLDDARLAPFLMCTYSIFIVITLFTLAAGRELVDF